MTKRTATGWRMAAVLAVFVGFSELVVGATEYVESFGNGMAEWGGRGAVEVRQAEGRLEASFSRQPMVPMPENGSMVATNGASGGAFEGDFPAAELKEMGFRFLAADVKPSEAIVRIFAGNRAYLHALDLSELTVGTWKVFRISLESLAAGKWNGGDSSEEQFRKNLERVTCVEVQVSRRGAKAQRYALDDFFVTRTIGGGISGGGGGGGASGNGVWARGVGPKEGAVEILWGELDTNTAYVVEWTAAQGEDGNWIWQKGATLQPTNSETSWRDESAGDERMRLYRLKAEED